MWRSLVLPLLLTLLIHGIGVALVIFGLPSASEQLLTRPLPKFVNAELVVLEKPKPKPAPKPEPKPKPAEPEPKPKPKPESKPEPKPAPKPKPDDSQQKKAEAERAEKQRQEAARERQRQELIDALSEEEEFLQSAEDANAASSYEAKIARAVSLAWSRPPSARNGMVVKLRIRLIRTGEVVDVQIIESSGDSAFDRSAIRAVQKVGGFPELADVEYRVFKKYFESFVFEFRPEDLRR